MKCTRCGQSEGKRGEMLFESNAIVIVYLCEECAESVLQEDDEVKRIIPSLDQ